MASTREPTSSDRGDATPSSAQERDNVAAAEYEIKNDVVGLKHRYPFAVGLGAAGFTLDGEARARLDENAAAGALCH